MIQTLLVAIISILPIIVLFSGMAVTPLLIAFALLILIVTPRAVLCQPKVFLANYRQVLCGLGMILVLPLLSTLWSITPDITLRTAGSTLLICVAGLLAFAYSPTLNGPNVKMLKLFAGSLLVVSVLVLLEKLPAGGVIRQMYSDVPYERFINKNINRGLCALVVMVWPLMLGFYLAGKQRLAWAVFAVFAVAILSMHSLSAKVGLVAGMVTFFGLRRYPVTLSRAIMVLLPLYLLSYPFLFKLLETTFFADPRVLAHMPESALHRLLIWHALLDEAMQKPLLGWGVDTTRSMPLTPAAFESIHLTTPPLHPHSPSIQLLLEEGLAGLLLTVLGFAALLREWVRMPVTDSLRRASAGALIVAYFATGVSSFGIWQSWWIATLWVSGMLWRWMGRERTPVSA